MDARHGSHLWNEYIDRYHYLGYQPLPGSQLRYFARTEGRVLTLLGFGAAAWKTAVRDPFIGWTSEQRQSRLHLVVNNARFLVLPWVQSRHLASRLLGMVARRLAHDWEQRYSYRPVVYLFGAKT
ncbi:Druantia anti-phage system protein DruA [Myxococcota bacterium]